MRRDLLVLSAAFTQRSVVSRARWRINSSRRRVAHDQRNGGGRAAETPYFYQSWLAQWILFQTLQLGGLSGLQWLRVFCVVGAFVGTLGAGLTWAAHEKIEFSRSARALAGASLLAFLIASNNLDLRPQSFSLFLCGFWIWALLKCWQEPNWKNVALLALLAALWANLHGAFVLAPATILVLTLAQFRVRALWLATAAVWSATLLNPHGMGLYFYLARLSQDAVSQKYIEEWRSPSFGEWHSALFLLAPLFLLILALWTRPPRKFWPFLAPVALAWIMGARDQRAMIWFGLFAAPLVAIWLATKIPARPAVPIPRAAQIINAVLLVFLLLCPLIFSPAFKTRIPWPPAFVARFAPTPAALFPNDPPLLLDSSTPTSAIVWWNRNPHDRPARVWCDMVCGSFLTWATRPGAGKSAILPLCEPRIELYPAAFWEDYLRLSSGPRDASQTLRERGFSQALLSTETQRPLFERLQNDGWKIVARNGSTALLKR